MKFLVLLILVATLVGFMVVQYFGSSFPTAIYAPATAPVVEPTPGGGAARKSNPTLAVTASSSGSNTTSSFRGPSGPPHIIGPSAPPPGN